MGIKPLYFFSSDRYFLFASEVRTLLDTALVPRRIDRAGLLNYLAFGSACDPVTLVDGVSALPPGHSLVWENGTISQKMYWDLRASKEQVGGPGISLYESGRKRIEEEIHAAIAQSIHMHMVSDVPVGVFLSGGIDSSAVTGILSRDGARLNTFSIVFREADYSEAEYSRLVAKTFHTEHHELLVSQRDALVAIPVASNPCRGDQGGAFRFRWRRVVRWVLDFQHRTAHGAIPASLALGSQVSSALFLKHVGVLHTRQ